jgi:hypothetical protein
MGLFGIKPKEKVNAAPPPAPAEKGKEPDGDEKPVMLNDDAEVDVNGTPVPLHELMAAYMEKQGTGEPAALADDDVVQLPDGQKVTIADLKASYGGGEGGGEALENAEAPQDVTAAPVVDEKKQLSNSKPAPRVVNTALKNAASRGDVSDPRGEGMDTQADRIARGSARYSLPVKQGGK